MSADFYYARRFILWERLWLSTPVWSSVLLLVRSQFHICACHLYLCLLTVLCVLHVHHTMCMFIGKDVFCIIFVCLLSLPLPFAPTLFLPLSLFSCLLLPLLGGLDSKGQEAMLRKNPDVIIATPGRLVDHLHNAPSFSLSTIEILVLDEADRSAWKHILFPNHSDCCTL